MVAWLLAPSTTQSRALGLVRIVVGVVFVAAGSGKFLDHAQAVTDFRHWGLTAATGALVSLIGVAELVGGAVLVFGVATRLAALILVGDMVGAIATAGRVDGGVHLIVPPLLAAACLLLAVRGGGARQPLRRAR